MLTNSALQAALQEFASQEVQSLRGSAGGEVLHREIMDLLPRIQSAVEFLGRCRVAGASLSLVAGEVPMVRVRLRDAKRTRTVGPSTWLADALCAFGWPQSPAMSNTGLRKGFPERLAAKMRKVMSQIRIAELEADVQSATAAALADEHQVGGIRDRLAKKRELERLRQLKVLADTFHGVSSDLVSEEDVVRLWRERQVRDVLES